MSRREFLKSIAIGSCVVIAGSLLWWSLNGHPSPDKINFDPDLSITKLMVGREEVVTITGRDKQGNLYDREMELKLILSVSGKRVNSEDVLIMKLEENSNGKIIVTILPKKIGQYCVEFTINGKRMKESVYNIEIVSDQSLYDNFPLSVYPAIKEDTNLIMFSRHSDLDPISPLKINFLPLLESLKSCTDYWPRSFDLLYNIVTDYGRSLYFFTNSEDTIPFLIHKYGFRNIDNASPKECIEFFNSIRIYGDIIQIFSESTPIRSNLLTRTKYELLRKFFLDKGKSDIKASELAIVTMAATTQHTLKYIKYRVRKCLPKSLRKTIRFSYFQINITLENELLLHISLVNFVPTSGAWQSSSTEVLPTNNSKRIRAVFSINLETDDRGRIQITEEGEHEFFGKVISDQEKSKRYGILRHTSDVIFFKDTSPTW